MAFINQCHFLFTTCYVLFLGYCHSHTLSRPLDGNNHASLSMRDKHEQWMATYGRMYKDLAEKEKRFNIFKENVEHIENINRASSSNHSLYTLGVNMFTDLSTEELIANYTGSKPFPHLQSMLGGSITTNNFKYQNITNAPPSMDWREMGAVTPIKAQGTCGCCWAFAVVATIEGMNQINTGKLISLSEQQLVDCDKTNHGCQGGGIRRAFRFIANNEGVVGEQVYPYKGIQGQCQALQGERVAISGFERVPTLNEDALLQAVSKQPVAVRVDSSGFRHYESGIYNGECGTNLNHDVTIVGYGTENGNNYWLDKLSWGVDWGEKGFMRIMRGSNMCGLAIAPSYPI